MIRSIYLKAQVLVISILTVLLCSSSIHGQTGTVYYETTVHIDPPEGRPVDDDFPTKRKSQYALHYNGSKSLYSKDTDYEDPEMAERRARRGWGSRGNTRHQIYYDHETDTGAEQVDFFKKEFLVQDDTLADLQWKLVPTEQRDILGYTVIRAILNDTSKVVEAWFTPQIPVSVGPEQYYGLPGLILAVTIDEKRVVLATKVEQFEEAVALDIPREGKKMNREEFEKLKEEKMAEMKKMWGGNKRRWR